MKIIEKICIEATKKIKGSIDKIELNKNRIKYIGKKGELTKIIKDIKNVPIEKRAFLGKIINSTKKILEESIKLKLEELENKRIQSNQTKIDVSLPGIGQLEGSLHPINLELDKIKTYFTSMGFDICDGPEIEDEYHNFEALNIPKYHPARTTHDTFYLNSELVLRTHTSGMQIRAMKRENPPIRMLSAGKVYRCDLDISHTPMFHQVEALWVDENVSFSNLKGILKNFLINFFEKKDIKIRIRPSYFPFTEPSVEIDIECNICSGKGCNLCKKTGWIEVLGCGMVHPNVFKFSNIDKLKYRGFAIGMGVERLVMIKYGIDDLRLFFKNDLGFLTQFQ